MKTYYYYYYVHKNGFGCGICYSECSKFPLSYVTISLIKKFGISSTVSFWKEIDYVEFEEMNKIINEANNERDTEEKD